MVRYLERNRAVGPGARGVADCEIPSVTERNGAHGASNTHPVAEESAFINVVPDVAQLHGRNLPFVGLGVPAVDERGAGEFGRYECLGTSDKVLDFCFPTNFATDLVTSSAANKIHFLMQFHEWLWAKSVFLM